MFGMGRGTKPPAPARKVEPTRKPPLVSVTVQLDPRQRDKFELLGGEAWLREQIEQARVPNVFNG